MRKLAWFSAGAVCAFVVIVWMLGKAEQQGLIAIMSTDERDARDQKLIGALRQSRTAHERRMGIAPYTSN
jgi:hypothetical protein